MAEQPGYADPSYFEQLYARDPDPWRFATSEYERDKYAATLAALPPRPFASGFEIGCSIGVLTRQLSERCDALLAVDVSDIALEQARQRCPGVSFANMDLRSEWPDGAFDLVLFSEVLYYLGLDGIRLVAKRTMDALAPGGVVGLVNWFGPTDGACTGDEAAELFIAEAGSRLAPWMQTRAEKYRLDIFTDGPADRSTARPTL
ncbi:MAG: class I SAM-dependent methyltransferase [Acetobacteraceae bacterium]|nr:class I SAM-dependent methyltransferase [Acetobacteraceae bacterium]